MLQPNACDCGLFYPRPLYLLYHYNTFHQFATTQIHALSSILRKIETSNYRYSAIKERTCESGRLFGNRVSINKKRSNILKSRHGTPGNLEFVLPAMPKGAKKPVAMNAQ
jgi:hypothetical protein